MPAAVDVVRRSSAAFSARDIDAMLANYAPDATVVDRSGLGLGEQHGHAELRPYYESIMHSAEVMQETFTVVAEADGLVVTDCELWARLVADPAGNGITANYGLVITVREGLIARLEIHPDGHAALVAARDAGLLPSR